MKWWWYAAGLPFLIAGVSLLFTGHRVAGAWFMCLSGVAVLGTILYDRVFGGEGPR